MSDDLFKKFLAQWQSRTKAEKEQIRARIRQGNFQHSDTGNAFLVERFNAIEAQGNVVPFRPSRTLSDN